jgi:hypothetical protein
MRPNQINSTKDSYVFSSFRIQDVMTLDPSCSSIYDTMITNKTKNKF